MEFKQESNGNSGVFFRSSITGVRISGWQVEVAPPGSDTGAIALQIHDGGGIKVRWKNLFVHPL
jgi:hypothetical protein